jgi:hypothetical protein
MPIDNPQGVSIPEPRIEKVLDYLGTYQSTLRKAFEDLPEETRSSLGGLPNPHLATGPMEVVVCTNGVFAAIRNSLDSVEIKATVVFPNAPEVTFIQYLNSVIDKTFTFRDPISKLSAMGNKATFQNSAVYEGMLTQLLIADREDRLWYPPATKVFLIGWKFLEVGDLHAKAQESAMQSLAQARGLVNLRSSSAARKLLEEYRALLATATSETELQAFLESHPEFVYPEYDSVLPRPSLAGERVPDFAFSFKSAFGTRWLFVEIERPGKLIFTKGKEFQFTSDFTQAKGQLLQWDTLITRDQAFFANRFAGLVKPEFHLIYGRDAELDAGRRDMLRAEFSTTPNRAFNTFDDLANRFETIIRRIFP